MNRIVHFFSYHNALPVALGVVFLGAGGVFAATNPEAFLASEESVISVDNTYIANVNLDAFTPQVQIMSVTEDDDTYYVQYVFSTISLVDATWQEAGLAREMSVDKEALGEYEDLGLYVTKQLNQLIDREIAHLKEVQQLERRQVTNKVVATAYSGLVGALLNDTIEEVPGYVPVVTPPPAPVASKTVRNDNDNSRGSITSSAPPPSPGAPTLQIIGNNPARIEKGGGYSDLGAVVSDDRDGNLGIKKFLNGVEVSVVSIDTSVVDEHEVLYRAVDRDGNVGEAVRTIIVFDPNAPKQSPESTTESTSTSTTPTSENDTSVEEPSPTTSTTTPDQTSAPESESESKNEVATTTVSSDSSTASSSPQTEQQTTTEASATSTQPTSDTTNMDTNESSTTTATSTTATSSETQVQ